MKFGQMMRSAVKSTKTTVIAFLVAGGAMLTAAVNVLDNDPNTFANWNEVVELCLIAIGLLFARDSDKSSEDVDCKDNCNHNH